MTFADFVGFLAAIALLVVSRIAESRRAKKQKSDDDQLDYDELSPSDKHELEKVQKLQQHLEDKAIRQEGKAPARQQAQKLESSLKAPRHEDKIAAPMLEVAPSASAYSLHRAKKIARGRAVIEQLPSKQSIFILTEIFSEPKGF